MMARGLVTIEGVLDEYMPTSNIVQIIRGHIVSSTDSVDVFRRGLEADAALSHKALHGALQAASEAGELSRQLTRGQFKLNMNFTASPDAMNSASRMVDRLTAGIIIAGLFIGSSIVYFAGIPPVIFGIPLLGFAGYVGSLVLSVWIIYDIIRSGRKKKG
jgi:ubiquinone biosynthesis protein